MPKTSQREIPALIVHQWLERWEEVKFSLEEKRRKPDPYFFVFMMPADKLRRLSNVYRRQADKPRTQDPGIQRGHVPERSEEIRRFIRGGFPWSDLSRQKQQLAEYRDLWMPGWLPTSIIVNILAPGTKRGKSSMSDRDAIEIKDLGDNMAKLILPEESDNIGWNPAVRPIEIIDGQHRLLAFEGDRPPEGIYELPVVAFYNLDITWQAYLFYMINIKPKRIDPSFAFDLYPILRIQDWLDKAPETAAIYRETRAQELTEVLWSHPESPWRRRISMLGERKRGTVTQAAFIRSLMVSYVKRGQKNSVGGLFGSEMTTDSNEVLFWDRAQQAAFLILVWRCMADSIRNCKEGWAEQLRQHPVQEELPTDDRRIPLDPAFVISHSLLATDQGVRGVLQVTNDMCYVAADEINLAEWEWEEEIEEGTIGEKVVTSALQSLELQPVKDFLQNITDQLSKFDWRTSSTPGLDETSRMAQMVFRGSGGYREIRRQLTQLLKGAENDQIREVATKVWNSLGY